jgi:hypothetical protein
MIELLKIAGLVLFVAASTFSMVVAVCAVLRGIE